MKVSKPLLNVSESYDYNHVYISLYCINYLLRQSPCMPRSAAANAQFHIWTVFGQFSYFWTADLKHYS